MQALKRDAVFACALGMFGVHKFRKRNIIMGVLYAVSFGLFGLGWIHDAATALLLIGDVKKQHTNDTPVPKRPKLSEKSKATLRIVDLVCDILAVIIIAVVALAAMPSVASVFGLLAVIPLLPIPPLQAWIRRQLSGDLKRLVAALLTLVMCLTYPTAAVPSTPTDIDTPAAVVTTTTAKSDKATTTDTSASTTTTAVSTTHTTAAKTTTTATAVTTAPTATTRATASNTTVKATSAAPVTTTAAPTTPPHTHDFNAATCNTPKTCRSCGATEGSANGHSFSSGTCTVCGESDPNYVEQDSTVVYVPRTGNKYHSIPNCGTMKNPSAMSLSEAQRLYQPCDNCW